MIEFTYLSYLLITIVMTIWVARTLSKNGLVFLEDSFHGNVRLAESINHLLVVGFYLLNIGYILLTLKTQRDILSLRNAIEFLSGKVGTVLLVIGVLHFFNVYVISRWRQRALRSQQDKKNKETYIANARLANEEA